MSDADKSGRQPASTPEKPMACSCCTQREATLSAESRIAVGFGVAVLTKDGKTVWRERGHDWRECMTVAEAEALAAAQPQRDWRIVLYGPLHGEIYQRRGDMNWVLIEQNQGFA
jgi:hypothetical protein